jgi:hypothetical protein
LQKKHKKYMRKWVFSAKKFKNYAYPPDQQQCEWRGEEGTGRGKQKKAKSDKIRVKAAGFVLCITWRLWCVEKNAFRKQINTSRELSNLQT